MRKPPAEGEKKDSAPIILLKSDMRYTISIVSGGHGNQTTGTWKILMSAYWVQFTKTGDPNGTGLPAWGPFSYRDPQSMIFGNSSSARLLPDKDALDFCTPDIRGNDGAGF